MFLQPSCGEKLTSVPEKMNEPHAAPARRVWQPFASVSRIRAL